MKATFRAPWLVSAIAIAQLANAADVTGTWIMAIEMQSGTGKATFVLTQQGDVVTGTYAGQFGEAPVTGRLKHSSITLAYRADVQGVPVDVTYVGTIAEQTMSGNVTIVGFGEGTFEGVKQ